MDNLIDAVYLDENIKKKIKFNRNLELVIWNTKKFFKKLNLNENFQQKYLNKIKRMIYRASEFLAEEKGVFGNWVNVSQEITGHKYENWIDPDGEVIANGKKIADEMDQESVKAQGYTSTPRRNYLLFENFDYQEDMPKKNVKIRTTNTQNPVTTEEVYENPQRKNTTKLVFVGLDSKGKLMVLDKEDKKVFVSIDYDGLVEPKDFLGQYLNKEFGISINYLELVAAEFFENDTSLYLAYSSKVDLSEDQSLVSLIFDNQSDLLDHKSQVVLDKFLSRNKILTEFRELVINNPGVIKEIRNRSSKKLQKQSNINTVKQEGLVYREYSIATESFGSIKIKIGTSNSKIRSLEFLLNDEFKNRYATFYSSFMFITSFLNYMLSMNEDITKVIEFLEGNMNMKTSLGLVSKVVYYSLQTLKEEV
ncbi:MAG: hypothetical protein HC932_04215 [Thermales bacterium]|nr:hypothetical protein [Thermales bacterium]